jgi:RNA polymerase sigma factor (sigma-70 family)
MGGIAMPDGVFAESTVLRAAAGDEAACDWLEREHYAPMVRAAYALTRNIELAREATQIAWTKAWPRLVSVHHPERVRSWLVAIAANEARQLLRGQHRRTAHEAEVGDVGLDLGDPASRIEAIDLERAMRRLSPQDRSLLAMRFAAGLHSNQIGAQSGMSASGVRSRLARLLDRLREDLADA